MIDFLIDVLPWSLAGNVRQERLYVLTLTALLAGTLLCLVALRIVVLDVLAVAVTGGAAAAWLLSSAPGEGSTLLVVLPGNGVTVADLAVVPALVLVLVLSWRRLRDR